MAADTTTIHSKHARQVVAAAAVVVAVRDYNFEPVFVAEFCSEP